MKKNEPQPGVELLPSSAAIVRARTGIDNAELKRLVQEKVAEIMAERDALVFEPFFRSRQVAYELKRLQSVPEQRKWSISFERYGCMICETRERIHAGHGMCDQCCSRWFRRLAQIIAEEITGEPARPARGATQAERRLLPNRPLDAAHRTWVEPIKKTDKVLYASVAKQLMVSASHVRRVAHGRECSKRVSAALKKEAERLRNGDDSE